MLRNRSRCIEEKEFSTMLVVRAEEFFGGESDFKRSELNE